MKLLSCADYEVAKQITNYKLEEALANYFNLCRKYLFSFQREGW
jgi:hypothetical protein